jgi:lyso-ornithine lipid O-acyltransferase
MHLRKIIRTLLIIALALTAIAAGILLNILLCFSAALRARFTAIGAMIWAKLMCRIMGVHLRKHGEIPRGTGSFTVCNHVSYIDILVLGSIRPSVFVARHDLKAWPVIGWLAALSGAIFLDRKSGQAVIDVMKIMDTRIRKGLNVILFPEGTTTDGKSVGTFKSALFELPARGNLPVMPLSIRYTCIDETPPGQNSPDSIAWYGDMTLLPHLWKILGYNSINVSVCMRSPILPEKIDTVTEARKSLCLFARQHVMAGFEEDVPQHKNRFSAKVVHEN